jgi:hypothetical protein
MMITINRFALAEPETLAIRGVALTIVGISAAGRAVICSFSEAKSILNLHSNFAF